MHLLHAHASRCQGQQLVLMTHMHICCKQPFCSKPADHCHDNIQGHRSRAAFLQHVPLFLCNFSSSIYDKPTHCCHDTVTGATCSEQLSCSMCHCSSATCQAAFMTYRDTASKQPLCSKLTNLCRANIQGHLFRAAFLQHVPLFIRNLSENVVLCLAAAAVESTAKTVLAHMELSWRKLVTSRMHSPYFENMVKHADLCQRGLFDILYCVCTITKNLLPYCIQMV